MGRSGARFGIAAALAALVGTPAAGARAGLGTPEAPVVEPDPTPSPSPGEERAPGDEPALRYARLDPEECVAELARRRAPFVRVGPVRGVLVPLRLTGPLHGVSFRSTVPTRQRSTTPWEIVDCRLALALDDFAVQLRAHDVVEVVHYSIYRPPPSGWPAGRVGSRHAGGLAIDAAWFVKSDGRKLEVERDFHGRIGAPPCGPRTAPEPATAQAIELRRIVCDAAEAKLFNVALTPDYNRAHFNHFHLEVAAGTHWFVVR